MIPVAALAPPLARVQPRSITPRESATMIERLGPRCAIGTDGMQWMVYRAGKGASINWDGQQWASDGFIHSDKQALIDCLKVKGLELSPHGQAALDRQDAKIWRWRKR
jgi:hypothetical protein